MLGIIHRTTSSLSMRHDSPQDVLAGATLFRKIETEDLENFIFLLPEKAS